MRDEMMHDELRIDSADADATVALGRAVGSCCVAGDVVALEGELGAGKTQFARGLAEGLGLDPLQVSSPTFVIMQEYVHKAADGIGGDRGQPGGVTADDIRGIVEALIHIDAYRLRSAEDLASVGWEGDGASLREGAVLAIEWASLLGEALPSDRLTVRIEHEMAGRSVCLVGHGAWRARMARLREVLDAVTRQN